MIEQIKSLYHFVTPKFQNVFLEYKVDFKPRNDGKAHALLYDIVNAQRKNYIELLNQFLELKDNIQEIKDSSNENDASQPSWNNDFLPGLDIVGIYGMLATKNPKVYLEIGSGNSTKVARKAIQDQKLDTKIVSIDPYPRAEIDALSDKVIRMPLENMTSYDDIYNLEAGDILFVDNSHRCLPNSDVTVCFLELLPKLKTGVIVHIHDIYIPYDYPQFMCDRAYSEQYILAAILLANPQKYVTILPNYFISEDKELASKISPMWEHKNLKGVERHGGSYWFLVNQ